MLSTSLLLAALTGYLLTIAVETPILVLLLSARVPVRRRVALGVWLTACTYPIVVLAMPALLLPSGLTLYVVVAEVFAPLAECGLFYWRTGALGARDAAAIVAANLASFGVGALVYPLG
jgi:hypothetical protein